MRLTLRTLLSWKDGMLEPEAARDFAARVASSDPARRLVERIDEVAARATLSAAAPDAAGFAADANTTAEYLDNALDAGQLAEFERACFQSDPLLAETAATHELLAAWWREPAPDLSAAESRRLLEAARGRGDGVPLPAPSPAAVHPRITAPAVRPAARSRRAPASAWLLVAAALLLLVTLVGVLGWSLTRGAKRPAERREVAARAPDDVPAAPATVPAGNAFTEPDADARPADSAAVPTVAGPATDRPPVAAPPPAPAGVPGNAPTVDGAAAAVSSTAPGAAAMPPGGSADGGDVPPAVTPEVAPAAAVPEPAPAPAADQRVPQGDALAIAAPAAVAPAVVAPAAAAAPPAGPAVGQARIDGPAVLLYRPSGVAAAPWLAGAEGTAFELPVELVAPPFGAPTLDVGGTRIALEPGTRAALARDADGTTRLEVVFGAAAVAVSGRLGVTAGDLAGVVTAAGPIGVAVDLHRDPGAAVEDACRVARIVPVATPADWRQTAADGGARAAPLAGIAAVVAVPAGAALAWRSDRPDVAEIAAAGPTPAWLAGQRGVDRSDGWAARALARRLAAGTVAVPALRELAADRRVEARVAAAATLALVGEFDEAARLLCADGTAALPAEWWDRLDDVAVRRALARGPKAADGLARALSAQVPPGAAETLLRFARGFTDEQLADGGAADLVAALESPHLVVRRSAIRNLVDITRATGAERIQYRADWTSAAQREKGAAWWRARLDQGRIRRDAAAR